MFGNSILVAWYFTYGILTVLTSAVVELTAEALHLRVVMTAGFILVWSVFYAFAID